MELVVLCAVLCSHCLDLARLPVFLLAVMPIEQPKVVSRKDVIRRSAKGATQKKCIPKFSCCNLLLVTFNFNLTSHVERCASKSIRSGLVSFYGMQLLQQLYRVFQKTAPLFYFCDNFRKWTPILTIFSPLEPEIYDA